MVFRTGLVRGIIIGVAAAAALTVGCRPAETRRQQLESRYPLDRARAAVASAEAGDLDAVHELVDLLEDQDRAVRMYSILALERLCGQTYGYQYFAPEPQRAEAVLRWRAALRDGQVVVKPQSDAAMRTAQPATTASAAQPINAEGHTP